MITPLDIEKKEFKKKIRGYCTDDVDDFIFSVRNDFESIYRENIELKEKLESLSGELQKYKNIEDTLQNTLIVAQKASEDLNQSAVKKAEAIVMEAENKRDAIIKDSNDQVVKIKSEYESIRRNFEIYKSRYKNLLEQKLRDIDMNFNIYQEERDE